MQYNSLQFTVRGKTNAQFSLNPPYESQFVREIFNWKFWTPCEVARRLEIRKFPKEVDRKKLYKEVIQAELTAAHDRA